jgi:hypothetical protein
VQVSVTDHEVILSDSGEVVATIRWEDVREVRIRTTSDGPFVDDVFFIVRDAAGQVSIPQSAMPPGLVERLQALPGFDNEAMIQAMTSMRDAEFVCYSADGPAGGEPT